MSGDVERVAVILRKWAFDGSARTAEQVAQEIMRETRLIDAQALRAEAVRMDIDDICDWLTTRAGRENDHD